MSEFNSDVEKDFCGALGTILVRQWSKGYDQGKYDPDFDNTAEDEEEDRTVFDSGRDALDTIKSLGFKIEISK